MTQLEQGQEVKKKPIPMGTISYSDEVTDQELAAFNAVTCQELTPVQIERIVEPAEIFPNEETVLSMHWHPEFIPFELIKQRIDKTYPNKKQEFFIPTQHNVVMSYDGKYSGVEVDCYSPEFNRKVQLLCHFDKKKADQGHVFHNMMTHTFKYRASQLYEFIDTILETTYRERLEEAARETGANEEVVSFVQNHISKLKKLILKYESTIPAEMLRNKLLRNFIEELGEYYDSDLIERAQVFLTKVKQIVKRGFSPKYFYNTQEIIDEVRMLGGGIIIPHPEQFWPILMADYDIDGIEVWNPQSRRYTEYLINVIRRQNETERYRKKPLLIVMGDDCHLGEKVKEPGKANREKVSRQVGLQPGWNDVALQKSLALAGCSKKSFIKEYKARLA